ncbi:hypothetical protein BGZ98_009354 [Dissophora globulifera]|nr:hypothetical protein BGZ98_009354 [Dissophora globulifera]
MPITRGKRAVRNDKSPSSTSQPIPSSPTIPATAEQRGRSRTTSLALTSSPSSSLHASTDTQPTVEPDTDAKITTVRTARGARRAMAPITAVTTHVTTELSTRLHGQGTEKDDDVEAPRWGRMDSRAFFERRPQEVRMKAPWHNPSRDTDTSSSTYKRQTPSVSTRDRYDTTTLPSRHITTLVETAAASPLGTSELSDDDMDDRLSRLSFTPPPPPPLFDMEGLGEEEDKDRDDDDLQATSGYTWEKIKESARPGAFPLSQHTHRQFADLTTADLSSANNSTSSSHNGYASPFLVDKGAMVQTNAHEEDDDKDDDPFGFTKVERKLGKIRSLQHKLLPVNATNSHSVFNPATPTTDNIHNSSSKHVGIVRSVDRDLDGTVAERAATRRRGDVKGKGKAIDQGPSTQQPLGSHSNGYNVNNEADDQEDVQRAILLSLGKVFDAEHGEGCSTSAPLSSSSSQLPIVWLSSESDLPSCDESAAGREKGIPASTLVTARSDRAVQGLDDLDSDDDLALGFGDGNRSRVGLGHGQGQMPPSTPQKKKPAIVSIDSDDDDDRSPIVIETTPKRMTKPEAGMPLSMESPVSYTATGRRTGKKKYLTTEQLEAMLPRRRRTHSRNEEAVVISSSSSSGEDEEEEVLVRRRRGGLGTGSAVTKQRSRQKQDTTEKKRKADTAISTPTPKRSQGSKASLKSTEDKAKVNGSNYKKKDPDENKSSWSAAQWAAHQERIKYFQQLDDFELEVEEV